MNTTPYDESQQPAESQFTILHQTKTKYKQLGSSLLLTSSLISHKQKLHKRRQEHQQSQPLTSPSALLTTNKLNLDVRPLQQPSQSYSNLQELKHHAKKLQQEHLVKMGKENDSKEIAMHHKTKTENIFEISSFKDKHRKLNKRKIVKGRPDICTLIKKRKFLTPFGQEKLLLSKPSQASNIRQTIKDILSKNIEPNFLNIKYEPGAHLTPHFDDECMKEQSLELMELPPRNKRLTFGRSISSFKTIESSIERPPLLVQDGQICRPRRRGRHLSQNQKRFSNCNTIE